jgi:hypothetical protein
MSGGVRGNETETAYNRDRGPGKRRRVADRVGRET